jgi:type IX secretion system substrate protein
MKNIAYTAIFLLFNFAASAQSLEVVEFDPNPKGFIGQEIKTTFKIKNISTEPVYYNITVTKEQIGSSQKLYLCIDNDCGKGDIARRNTKIADLALKIMPGMVDESVVAVLENGLVQSMSTVTYRITNVKQPDEFIQVDLQYEVNELPSEGLLYSSKTVDLSDVYPNPVTETAIFDYKIKNDSKEAKIIIHNVLGSIAGEYKLNPYEQQLKVSVEDYNPGVYFYSLYIDNEGVATKKLVVRK